MNSYVDVSSMNTDSKASNNYTPEVQHKTKRQSLSNS